MSVRPFVLSVIKYRVFPHHSVRISRIVIMNTDTEFRADTDMRIYSL
jgi:hypothetical protein